MIEAVQFWNEPNNPVFWDADLDPEWTDFARMTALAAHAVRERAPDLRLILGGVSPVDPAFLALLRDHGLFEHLDAVAVHGYPLDWSPWPLDAWPRMNVGRDSVSKPSASACSSTARAAAAWARLVTTVTCDRPSPAYAGNMASASAAASTLRREVMPAAQEAYEAAGKGFEYGKFGVTDVLDAQRTLLRARADYLDALASGHRAAAELERQLGHHWEHAR